MATVFTHQTPYVKWTSGGHKKRCELSDVMLVFIDRSASQPHGVAALIQAKISTNIGISLTSKSEKRQFDLLSTRPTFDVDTTTAPTQIDLSHLNPDRALIYGLTSPDAIPLASTYGAFHHWLTADNLSLSVGKYAVSGNNCLAYVLTGMLIGNFGWKFQLPPIGKDWSDMDSQIPRDDWSTLVNYILQETFKKPMTAAYSASMRRQDRGQEDLLYYKATTPSGQAMLFLGYELSNSITAQSLSQGFNSDQGNWQPSNMDDEATVSDDGNANGDDELLETSDSNESGPMSVILFEIGSQNK